MVFIGISEVFLTNLILDFPIDFALKQLGIQLDLPKLLPILFKDLLSITIIFV